MDFGFEDIKNDTVFGYTKEELGINKKTNYFNDVSKILDNMSEDDFYKLIDDCVRRRNHE